MGRRAKPTALKVLAGNPGKRRLPENEVRPEPGLPPKPRMSKVASAEWDRLAPKLDKLGLLTNIDVMAFVAYCECWASVVEYRDAVKKHGAIFKNENGQLKKNPAVQMLNDSLRLMRQYLTEFGLSPSSRSRVSSEMREQPQQTLPGFEGQSVNPNKPQIPDGPLTDDDYFNTTIN